MDPEAFDELAGIMRRLAEGDAAAVVTLYRRFGDKVAGAVRAVLRQRGLTLVHDEVDGLVLDACFAIAVVARGWSPDGGAMPWTWARRRVENCVDRLLGQHTVSLDDNLRLFEQQLADESSFSAPASRAAASAEPLSSAFASLVEVDARCRLLRDAFDHASVSPFDREVWLQYAVEQHSGNRAPATTVGALFDMRPPTVRQRVRRSRERLRRLAASDDRFAPIADLALVG